MNIQKTGLAIVLALLTGTTTLSAQAELVDIFEHDALIHDIAFRNDMEGYAITDEFIYVTTDGGTTWERTMPIVFRPPFRSLALFGESGIIIGDMYGGVHLTTDPEAEWISRQLDGGDVTIENPPVIEVQAVNGAHWIALTNATLYMTRDSGKTFSRSYPSEHRMFIGIDVTSPGLMHAAENVAVVHRSTDGGETWDALGGLVHSFGNIYDVLFLSPDTGFVASWYPWNLFTTTDGGENWSAGPFEYPTSIAIAPSGTGAYTTSEYLRITHDRGMTWSDSIQLREPGDDPFNNYNRQKLVVAGDRGIFILTSNTEENRSRIARIDVPSSVIEERPLPPDALDLAGRR